MTEILGIGGEWLTNILADPLYGPLLKGTGSALLIALMAWLFIEQLIGRLPKPLLQRVAPFRLILSQTIGIPLVVLGHSADVVSYGPGPAGWKAAVLFGFIGGTLAPLVHPLLKKRLPWLTVSSGQEKPEGGTL